jgi:hypothetical protein
MKSVGIWRQPFDGSDRCALGLNCKHETCANRLAIDKNVAGTTNTVLATEVGARKPTVLP